MNPFFESESSMNESRIALAPQYMLRGIAVRVTSRARLMSVFALVASLSALILSPAASANAQSVANPTVAAVSTDSVKADPVISMVNINTANAESLAQNLRGVGQSRAQEIVRHREAYGPFASPEELMEVKGIGQSTLEQNRSRITLE